jgi:hypothetical protein
MSQSSGAEMDKPLLKTTFGEIQKAGGFTMKVGSRDAVRLRGYWDGGEGVSPVVMVKDLRKEQIRMLREMIAVERDPVIRGIYETHLNLLVDTLHERGD